MNFCNSKCNIKVKCKTYLSRITGHIYNSSWIKENLSHFSLYVLFLVYLPLFGVLNIYQIFIQCLPVPYPAAKGKSKVLTLLWCLCGERHWLPCDVCFCDWFSCVLFIRTVNRMSNKTSCKIFACLFTVKPVLSSHPSKAQKVAA